MHSNSIHARVELADLQITSITLAGLYRLLGGDLVGMTSVPEATLAREAGMCYATVAIVTNYAAGISPTRLTHQEVVDMMLQNGENIRKLIMQAVAWIDADRACRCQRALDQTSPE